MLQGFFVSSLLRSGACWFPRFCIVALLCLGASLRWRFHAAWLLCFIVSMLQRCCIAILWSFRRYRSSEKSVQYVHLPHARYCVNGKGQAFGFLGCHNLSVCNL